LASIDGAGRAAIKVFQIGRYVWVPCQPLMYWPRDKREIEVGIAVVPGAILVRAMLVPATLLGLDKRAWRPVRRGGRGPKWGDGS
jgi:hypothetical protein